MANCFVDILKMVEAHVPQAVGGSDRDENLRASLVSIANSEIDEIDREQRWSLSYAEPFFTTTAGTERYVLPYPDPGTVISLETNPLMISRAYYVNSTGKPVLLERMDQYELQRVYGESLGLGASATTPPTGAPQKFAVIASTSVQGGIDLGSPQLTVFLYPTPNAAGPETNGNYKIRVAGYWKTPPIVESLGNTAGSTTLTYSTPGAGNYVSALGVPASSASYDLFLAIRSGGNVTGLTKYPNADHISSWSANTANTVTLGTAAPTTTSNLPVYFNATNWIITHWPKLLLFGMLRQIGNYYNKTEMFQVWDAKFKEQMDKLREYEFDRARGIEMLAAAVSGQHASPLRTIDIQPAIDVRGGSW